MAKLKKDGKPRKIREKKIGVLGPPMPVDLLAEVLLTLLFSSSK